MKFQKPCVPVLAGVYAESELRGHLGDTYIPLRILCDIPFLSYFYHKKQHCRDEHSEQNSCLQTLICLFHHCHSGIFQFFPVLSLHKYGSCFSLKAASVLCPRGTFLFCAFRFFFRALRFCLRILIILLKCFRIFRKTQNAVSCVFDA